MLFEGARKRLANEWERGLIGNDIVVASRVSSEFDLGVFSGNRSGLLT